MTEIAITFKLSIPAKTCDFWIELLPILKRHLRLFEQYVTLEERELKERTLCEIDQHLSDPRNFETGYVIDDAFGGQKISQSIQYVELRGQSRFIFQIDDCLTTPIDFADDLAKVFEVTNLLMADFGSRYKRTLKPYVSQPNSNLYLGPGLINTHYRKYLEGVSSEMWFGETFWQYSSCTKDELLEQDWLKIRHLPKGVIHVRAWPEPFTTAEGEQGIVQRRLLKLLFDIDENKPHGNFTSESSGVYQQSVLVSKDGKVISKSRLEEK